MTEQATLTPEQAIMALAEAKCLACNGYLRGQTHDQLGGGEVSEPYDIDCDACLGADGKPTGARFPTLRVVCKPKPTSEYTPAQSPLWHSGDSCPLCQGRRWTPVSPDDWKTITDALEADGWEVERTMRRWIVFRINEMDMEANRELSIAAGRAIKAANA
jgi:hypothetical protein